MPGAPLDYLLIRQLLPYHPQLSPAHFGRYAQKGESGTTTTYPSLLRVATAMARELKSSAKAHQFLQSERLWQIC